MSTQRYVTLPFIWHRNFSRLLQNSHCEKGHLYGAGVPQNKYFRAQISTLAYDCNAYLQQHKIRRGILTQICARAGIVKKSPKCSAPLSSSSPALLPVAARSCCTAPRLYKPESLQAPAVESGASDQKSCQLSQLTSGATAVLFSSLARLTHDGHFCALVDMADCFDPYSAKRAGIALDRLLWVRCGLEMKHKCKGNRNCNMRSEGENTGKRHLEQAFKAADVLVQNGGFEMIAVDLSNVEQRQLRKVPLTTWFRFARVAEKTQTALVFLMPYPSAHLCAALTVNMQIEIASWEKGIAQRAEILGAAGLLSRTTTFLEKCCQSGEQEVLKTPRMQKLNSCAGAQQPDCVTEEKSRTNDVPNKATKRFEHTHLLNAINCDMGISEGRKPMQPARPKFTAKSMWK